MVRVNKADRVTGDTTYFEYAGLSTDTKPTDGVSTGSWFHEVDTSKVYAYDEHTETWYEQYYLGGDS